ncbi:MAG: L-2-hydroxyglutarate oxidase [Chloroflexi bacterium]|nr:L-2-hydroxyglutarate oxidase [Chloroflexota bacterium]
MIERKRFDIAIVGGGIVGLATAYRLLQKRPDLRLVILEKEAEVATHQSGHNSGVLHAGLYYVPGSLKARLCREGKQMVQEFADAHGIRYELCGKVVVALDESELERLENIRVRAEANGVEGLRAISGEELREIEPHCLGVRALHSPRTGIINFREVALAIADDVRAMGGEIRTSSPVTDIEERDEELILTIRSADGVERVVRADHVITCAGVYSDRVAAMTGDAADERIVPFRGDYYTLTEDARYLCRSLIYPVPDPSFPFLGVHLTKRIDGEVWAGPNAVLAFSREGYGRGDINPKDLFGALTYRGFQRLATKFLGTGLAEMWRDWYKPAFLAALQKMTPDLRGDQLIWGPSGVRAQSLKRDGKMVDDFSLAQSGRLMHVRNAPSPAATASLAIGNHLSGLAIEQFEL